MQDTNNFYFAYPGQVNQRVREARHDTFAGPCPDARPKLEVEDGDFLSLVQDGVDRAGRYRFAGFFQIVGFDGLNVPACRGGVLKPLLWHGA